MNDQDTAPATPSADQAGSANAQLDDGWFYAMAGRKAGPVSRDTVLSIFRAASAKADFLVWHPSLGDWVPIERTVLLNHELSPPALPEAQPTRRGIGATLFSFQGRLARLPYLLWSSALVTVYVAIVAAVLAATHLGISTPDASALRVGLVLPFLPSLLALTTRRLHDLNRSGWHLLWVFPVTWAPSVAVDPTSRFSLTMGSLLVDLWLLFWPGTRGPNSFGPDPKGRAGAPSRGQAPGPAGRSRRRRPWWVVGGLVIAAIAAIAIYVAGADNGLPICADPSVGDKVKAIVSRNAANEQAVVLSGGLSNVDFSIRDVRTLSNDEPLNGRTCVATVAVRAKSGLLGSGEVGAMETTFTVQKVDNQSGQYVVTVTR